MKKALGVLILTGLLIDLTRAQAVYPGSVSSPIKSIPAPTPYAVTVKDANSSVWERTDYEYGPSGQIVSRKHSYTQLATGLHYWQNGQWLDSKAWISILPNGTAAATNGQHQAYFPGDIYNGTIELVTPDGQHLNSRPVGLSYDDGTNSVLIAELTNSVGMVVGSNVVIYPNAFTGLKADLRYTYKRAGFEQDIILRQQPPTPESLGLNPDNAKLEVLTEFFSPPQPTIKATTLPAQAGLSLTDQSLTFGAMKMVLGRAFLLGTNAVAPRARVSKQWVLLDGRQFLVEEVPVNAIADKLATLPLMAMRSGSSKTWHTASRHLMLPPQRLAKNNTSKSMMLAKAELPAQGFVLDYQTENGSLTDFTFQADLTYYISGAVDISGTTTFEGGTVIKYEPGVGAKISADTVSCQTDMDRPAIFTAQDDDAVGETISGSSGTPSGYYADAALEVDHDGNTTLEHVRMAYASTGFNDLGDYGYYTVDTARDVQILNCDSGFYINGNNNNGSLLFENGLVSGTVTPFNGYGWSGIVEHATVNGCSVLANDDLSNGNPLYFTNSVLANASLPGYAMTLDGSNNGFFNCPVFGTSQYTSATWPFQTAGAADYYLTNGCVFRDVGTTNIDPWLLADISTKTTYPPIVYSNVSIASATTFSPQAQRDTDTPDLGYHYDPIDWCFGGVYANSNVTFTAGTIMGWFELPGSGGPGFGLAITNGMQAVFNGTVTQPCGSVRYDTVQEGGNGNWKDKGWLAGLIGAGADNPAPAAQLVAVFTHFNRLAASPGPFRDYYAPFMLQVTNCEIWGTFGGYNMLGSYINCLIDRCNFWQGTASAYPYAIFRNCTFYGGSFGITHWESSYYGDGPPYWYSSVHNCAFDGTTFSIDDPFGVNTNYANYNFNAYVSGASQLSPEGTNNVVVTSSFNWQSSWLGNYYLPYDSPLIDEGDRTADQLGLYHFTTQSDQTPETNSIVDIGYHYVSVDYYSGIPIDTDGDGIPDYLEDANGNGLVDTGETDWQSATDLGLKVHITQPRQAAIMP